MQSSVEDVEFSKIESSKFASVQEVASSEEETSGC